MNRARFAPATAGWVLILLGALAGCSPASPSAQATSSSVPQAAASAGGAPTDAAPIAPEVNPAGDIPDSQAFVPWAPADTSFTLKVPEGWAQSMQASGATVFTDKLNSITITASADATAPTIASVTRDLAAIRAASTGWQAGTVSGISRTSGPALMATYRADAVADPVTGKVRSDDVERYVFHHAGQSVVLTLAGPHGADNVDPWRIVTDSFAWTP